MELISKAPKAIYIYFVKKKKGHRHVNMENKKDVGGGAKLSIQ